MSNDPGPFWEANIQSMAAGCDHAEALHPHWPPVCRSLPTGLMLTAMCYPPASFISRQVICPLVSVAMAIRALRPG